MDRVERICDLLLERRIRKKYIINARLEIARAPEISEEDGAGRVLHAHAPGIESTQDKTLRSMRKGFDTARIRECFDVLRKTPDVPPRVLHPRQHRREPSRKCARSDLSPGSWALDSIAISILRTSPFSGLEELVAANPGYHIAPSGKIYSDGCSEQDLRTLRREIYRGFFTTRQLLQIARKGAQNGFLGFLPAVLPRFPRLAWCLARSRRASERRRRAECRRAGRRVDDAGGLAAGDWRFGNPDCGSERGLSERRLFSRLVPMGSPEAAPDPLGAGAPSACGEAALSSYRTSSLRVQSVAWRNRYAPWSTAATRSDTTAVRRRNPSASRHRRRRRS